MRHPLPLALLAALAALHASAFRVAGAEPVQVHLRWEYKDFAPRVEIAEAKPSAPLWDTRSVGSPKLAPIGARIPDGTFGLEPGQSKRIALLVTNPTDQTLFFFASPHGVLPVEHSLGFHFKCLCVGEAYRVQPGETWYRIVELQLGRHFEGQEITLTHTLIGIDGKRAAAYPPRRSLEE